MSALGVDAPVRSRCSWAMLNKIRAISAIKRAPMSFVSASEEGARIGGRAHASPGRDAPLGRTRRRVVLGPRLDPSPAPSI